MKPPFSFKAHYNQQTYELEFELDFITLRNLDNFVLAVPSKIDGYSIKKINSISIRCNDIIDPYITNDQIESYKHYANIFIPSSIDYLDRKAFDKISGSRIFFQDSIRYFVYKNNICFSLDDANVLRVKEYFDTSGSSYIFDVASPKSVHFGKKWSYVCHNGLCEIFDVHHMVRGSRCYVLETHISTKPISRISNDVIWKISQDKDVIYIPESIEFDGGTNDYQNKLIIHGSKVIYSEYSCYAPNEYAFHNLMPIDLIYENGVALIVEDKMSVTRYAIYLSFEDDKQELVLPNKIQNYQIKSYKNVTNKNATSYQIDETYIFSETKYNCPNIREIKLPVDCISFAKRIDIPEFKNVTSILLPPTLKAINIGLYDYFENINEVILPDHIIKIVGNDNMGRRVLVFHQGEKAIVPNQKTFIPLLTYTKNYYTKEVYYPLISGFISKGTFDGFDYVIMNYYNEKVICICKYTGRNRKIIVPPMIDKITVKLIAPLAFEDKLVNDIYIPKSIEYIGAHWCNKKPCLHYNGTLNDFKKITFDNQTFLDAKYVKFENF